MKIRRTSAALMSAAALTVTGAAMATPASAQAPVFAGGLINVNVSDVDVLNDSLNNLDLRILNNVLNDNNVGVGVVAQVAAVVCDTNVGGILGQLEDTGTATCEAGQDAGSIVFTVVE